MITVESVFSFAVIILFINALASLLSVIAAVVLFLLEKFEKKNQS